MKCIYSIGEAAMPFMCTDCKQKIEDGDQVCVWEKESGAIFVRFICMQCYERSGSYAYVDVFDDETD
jgi:hypothetical protein